MDRQLAALMEQGRYRELADYVRLEFDVDLDPGWFWREFGFVCPWKGDPRIWLKRELNKRGLLYKPRPREDDGDYPIVRLVVLLHTGFVGVPELPEHLARLHGEHLSFSERREESRPIAIAPARSRVFNTAGVIKPIDRVAARVAQEPVPDLPRAPSERIKLSVDDPRAVARKGQHVMAAGGEVGAVIGVRKCGRHGCRGVQLRTKWPDGEETRPCTRGMTFDGEDTWRINPEDAADAEIDD